MKRSKIMSYFHYQPTFYHLHIHFTHCENFAWDKRDNVRLDDAITNIEMLPDYYQRATMTYKVGTQMPLFNILVEKGILEPEQPIEEVKVDDEFVITTSAAVPAEEEKKAEEIEEPSTITAA